MCRITKFTALDIDKVVEIGEFMRDLLEDANADFIDLVSYGGGECLVVAKY